jgi:hypothetical protein
MSRPFLCSFSKFVILCQTAPDICTAQVTSITLLPFESRSPMKEEIDACLNQCPASNAAAFSQLLVSQPLPP